MFNDISKEDNNTGIEIKRFKSSENNGDIIVKDFKKTEVNFERKYFQRKPFTLQQVINECVIHDSGYIWISLQPATTNQKEGAQLRIRIVIMKDQSGNIETVLFRSVIDKLSNNNCYDLEKMRIQKFLNNRILKSTESKTVTENNSTNIELTDDELNTSPFEKLKILKLLK